jgi:pilus assembly protein Flp/PilA
MRFLRCDAGATSIEYGLIAAGISIGIVAIVNGLGSALGSKYSTLATSLK